MGGIGMQDVKDTKNEYKESFLKMILKSVEMKWKTDVRL